MVSSVIIREFREIIGDTSVHTFNEVEADGINASWQLTNKPVVPTTESLFLNGVIQQNGIANTTTSNVISEGDSSFSVVASNNLAVGEIIFLSASIDPQKLKIVSIDENTIYVNQAIENNYGAGVVVYVGTFEYEINSKDGIIYFDVAPNAGVVMTCHYDYTRYSDITLSQALNQASEEVSIDIGETVNLEILAHKALVFLKAHIKTIERQVTTGAASAIKVKQGSTSLDLGGSTKALQDQLYGLRRDYESVMTRYQMNRLDEHLGTGVVGPEAYLNG